MNEPLLGIFWFVADASGITHLLVRSCPLDTAELYGDRLTFPHGHYDTWEAWRRRALPLPAPALRPIVVATEYDAWPRGRIVFERPPSRFVIYADRQLLAPVRLARVLTAFALPQEQTSVCPDLHYSRAKRLPPESTAGDRA
ncbi:hypothetical protein [Roseomonas sp. KE0001]|uniref:hypothetical protein n=1 Tax=Roseomonas sp. KE0001 TaxID=2479201 RepID=UPI0018E05141|nr:hypothetical protein [Roseomonas sp. KE0001]